MSLTVLWANNSSQACGGTLQCSHSMAMALPDCTHRVWFSGEPPEATKDFLKGVAEIRTGKTIEEEIRDSGDYDLIVCQNTPKGQLPKTSVPMVYYLHSMAGAKDFQGPRFCVSRWLANKAGWPEDTILYQPVTIPKPPNRRPTDRICVGRICTPSDRKWKLVEWLPHMEAIKDVEGIEFHLVGCPKGSREQVQTRLGNVVFHEASVAAKALLREWHVLLYTSGVEESFGRVLREAQRCGVYPIVSRRGGFIEQVEQCGGTLVETPEDVREAFLEGGDVVFSDLEGMTKKADQYGSLQAWRDGFLKRLGEIL